MFEIKHTLCPSCSVGCGINVILDGEEIIGTFPYKRHPVNAGKNCSNGRNSIESYQNKFQNALVSSLETETEKAMGDVLKELKSTNAANVTVICSGNDSVEEINAIKDFCESNGYNIAFYADNLRDFAEVASYDDIENAGKVFVIGDILYENPLIGRRIIHAKQNDAKIFALGKNIDSVTFNIADEVSNASIQEFLDVNADNIGDESIIIFNYVDNQDDLEKLDNVGCKVLPLYSKSNSKGVLSAVNVKSKEEIIELLDDTELLFVFNDDIVNEIEYDFTKISKIITFAPCENDTTKISDIVIPIKTWLENDGSFVNAMGKSQKFNAVIQSDDFSEIEIIDKLNN